LRRAKRANKLMKRKRHTPEEIIKKLREAATLLAGGQCIEEVCKKLEVSPPTCHRWRQEDGGAKEETVKRLKELEKESAQLKRLVAVYPWTRRCSRSSWRETK
jgi:putative transposase